MQKTWHYSLCSGYESPVALLHSIKVIFSSKALGATWYSDWDVPQMYFLGDMVTKCRTLRGNHILVPCPWESKHLSHPTGKYICGKSLSSSNCQLATTLPFPLNKNLKTSCRKETVTGSRLLLLRRRFVAVLNRATSSRTTSIGGLGFSKYLKDHRWDISQFWNALC